MSAWYDRQPRCGNELTYQGQTVRCVLSPGCRDGHCWEPFRVEDTQGSGCGAENEAEEAT